MRSFKKYIEMAAHAHPGPTVPEKIDYPVLKDLLSVIPKEFQKQVLHWALEHSNLEADKGRTILAKQATKILRSMNPKGNDPAKQTIYPEDFFTTDRLRDLANNEWGVNADELEQKLKPLYAHFDQKYEPQYIHINDKFGFSVPELNDALKAKGKTPFKLSELIKSRENNDFFDDPVKRDPYGRNVTPTRGISTVGTKFGIDPATGRGVYSGRDYDFGTSDEAASRLLTQMRHAGNEEEGKKKELDPDIVKTATDKAIGDSMGGRGGSVETTEKAALNYSELIRAELEKQLNAGTRTTNQLPGAYTVTSNGTELAKGELGTPGTYKVIYKGIGGPKDTQNPFYKTGTTNSEGEPVVVMRRTVRVPDITKPGSAPLQFQAWQVLNKANKNKVNDKGEKDELKASSFHRNLPDVNYIKRNKYQPFAVEIEKLLDDNWKVYNTKGIPLTPEEINSTAVKSSLTFEKGADQQLKVVRTPTGWEAQVPAGHEDIKPEELENLGFSKEAPVIGGAVKYPAKTVKDSARLANPAALKAFQDDWMNNPEKWGESGPLMLPDGRVNPAHSLGQAAFNAVSRHKKFGGGEMSINDALSGAYNRAQGYYNNPKFVYGDYHDQDFKNKLAEIIGSGNVEHWINALDNHINDSSKPMVIGSPADFKDQSTAQKPQFDKFLDLLRKNGIAWRKNKLSNLGADINDTSSRSIDKDLGDEGGASIGSTIAGRSDGGANRLIGGDENARAGRVKASKDFGQFTVHGKLEDPGLLKQDVNKLLSFGSCAKMSQYKDDPNYRNIYQRGKNLGYTVLTSGDIENLMHVASTAPQDAIGQSAILDAMGDIYELLLQRQIAQQNMYHSDSDEDKLDYQKLEDKSIIRNSLFKFAAIVDKTGFDPAVRSNFKREFDTVLSNYYGMSHASAFEGQAAPLNKFVQGSGFPDTVKSQIIDAAMKNNRQLVNSLFATTKAKTPPELEIFKYDLDQFEDRITEFVKQINGILWNAKAESERTGKPFFVQHQQQQAMNQAWMYIQGVQNQIGASLKDQVTANAAKPYLDVFKDVAQSVNKKFHDYITAENTKPLPSFGEYRLLKKAKSFFETDAIYDGSKGTFNWWGAPGSSGKSIEGDPIKHWAKKKKKKST